MAVESGVAEEDTSRTVTPALSENGDEDEGLPEQHDEKRLKTSETPIPEAGAPTHALAEEGAPAESTGAATAAANGAAKQVPAEASPSAGEGGPVPITARPAVLASTVHLASTVQAAAQADVTVTGGHEGPLRTVLAGGAVAPVPYGTVAGYVVPAVPSSASPAAKGGECATRSSQLLGAAADKPRQVSDARRKAVADCILRHTISLDKLSKMRIRCDQDPETRRQLKSEGRSLYTWYEQAIRAPGFRVQPGQLWNRLSKLFPDPPGTKKHGRHWVHPQNQRHLVGVRFATDGAAIVNALRNDNSLTVTILTDLYAGLGVRV